MENTLKWLVTSSENPDNISLFLKGAVVAGAFFGLDATVVSPLANDFVHFITLAIAFISSGFALWGGVRKVINQRWSSHPN